MLKGPCKDCPDRNPGCHGKCQKYIDFRAKLDAMNEKSAKQRKLESDLWFSSRHSKTKPKRK